MIDVNILNDFSEQLENTLFEYNKKNVFSLDITVTNECNYKCTYCFERKQYGMRTYTLDEMKNFIYTIINSDLFNTNFSILSLNFWGGEPTLYFEDILYYIDIFHDNPCIEFFIYTNGTIQKGLDAIVNKVIEYNCLDKLHIQISWDGDPVHSINRISKNNYIYDVKDSIEKYYNLGVNLDLKATLLPKDFKMLPEIWESYKNLNYKLNSDFYYIPTIDQTYYGSEYIDDFKESLAIICTKELDYISTRGHTLLKWFGEDLKTCSYCNSMLCVDIDGLIYPCHGFLYENSNIKQKECLGTIFDKDFINKFLLQSKEYIIPNEPEFCTNCESTFCVSCCVKDSIVSNKKSSYERWYDKKLSTRCTYFKIFGVYDKALHKIVSNIK